MLTVFTYFTESMDDIVTMQPTTGTSDIKVNRSVRPKYV